jgi:leucyl/phenylalanyl-tRNA--protein transferase
VSLLSDEHAHDRVLDVQWQTPHLATLGVQERSRSSYLADLPVALHLPLPAAFGGVPSADDPGEGVDQAR